MSSHRKPENEQLNDKLKKAAGELLEEEWLIAGQIQPDSALRERVLDAVGKERRSAIRKRRLIRIGQTAAMLMLTVGVILFCSPTARAGFVNALVTWYDECFSVEFNPGTMKDDPNTDPIVWKSGLTVVPDGYVLTEQNTGGSGVWEVYMNHAGEPLMFSGNTDGALTLYDTGFTMKEIKVGKKSGYYMRHKEDTITVVTWVEGRAVYSVTAYSPAITEGQLIAIAESAE